MSTPISGENQAKLVRIGGRKSSNDKGLQQTDVNAGKELQKTQSTVISNPNELMGRIAQLASAIKNETDKGANFKVIRPIKSSDWMDFREFSQCVG
jgi:hypothetical protein